MLDPFALLKFPLLMIRLFVQRWGWKPLMIGWPLVTLLAVFLNYKY